MSTGSEDLTVRVRFRRGILFVRAQWYPSRCDGLRERDSDKEQDEVQGRDVSLWPHHRNDRILMSDHVIPPSAGRLISMQTPTVEAMKSS